MKRIISNVFLIAATLVMCLVMALYLQGSGPMPRVTGVKYQSVQTLADGEAVVTVTVKNGKITAAEAELDGEAADGDAAALLDSVVERGTSQGIEPADDTETALLNGVQDCMVQAGIWDSANAAAAEADAAAGK